MHNYSTHSASRFPAFMPDGAQWGLILAVMGGLWVGWGQWPLNSAPGWLILMALVMAAYDLGERRVPNAVSGFTALMGLSFALINNGWIGLGDGLLAGLLGFGLMLLPFLLGQVGAGDVKAFAALSSFLTPFGCWDMFLYFAISGGLLALISIIVAGRGFNLFFVFKNYKFFRSMISDIQIPYCVPMACGAFIFVALEVRL